MKSQEQKIVIRVATKIEIRLDEGSDQWRVTGVYTPSHVDAQGALNDYFLNQAVHDKFGSDVQISGHYLETHLLCLFNRKTGEGFKVTYRLKRGKYLLKRS